MLMLKPSIALRRRVAQADRIGALHEAALAARVDQREAAAALAQEFGGAGAIGEARVGAEQEHQARLLIAGRRQRAARRSRLRAPASATSALGNSAGSDGKTTP